MKTATLLAVAIVLGGQWTSADAEVAVRNTPPRIAFFVFDKRYCRDLEFLGGLQEFGYIDGRNIRIECHHANGRGGNLLSIAQAIVRSKPDVIVARGHYLAEPTMQATRMIPIVAIASGDPVAAGWVRSLARPGGNITGLSYFQFELYAKRLEYLKAIVPGLHRVGMLVQPGLSNSLTDMYTKVTKAAARDLGLTVVVYEAKDRAGIERVFSRMREDRIQALHVLGYYMFAEEAHVIASLAEIHSIPVMHFTHEYPSVGGLMGYGPDYKAMRRRLAYYVDKILRGARPGDLPIEQPRDFIFSINLGTARGLGLTVPQSILARADKVID